jgi:hypothetical protein
MLRRINKNIEKCNSAKSMSKYKTLFTRNDIFIKYHLFSHSSFNIHVAQYYISGIRIANILGPNESLSKKNKQLFALYRVLYS